MRKTLLLVPLVLVVLAGCGISNPQGPDESAIGRRAVPAEDCTDPIHTPC